MQPPRVWKGNWLCLPVRAELTSAMWLLFWKGIWDITGLWDTIVHQVVLVRWEILCKNNPSLVLFNTIKPLRRFPIWSISTDTFKMLIPIFYMHFSWLLWSLPGWEICKNWSLDKVVGCFHHNRFVFFPHESRVLSQQPSVWSSQIESNIVTLTLQRKVRVSQWLLKAIEFWVRIAPSSRMLSMLKLLCNTDSY